MQLLSALIYVLQACNEEVPGEKADECVVSSGEGKTQLQPGTGPWASSREG